MVTQSEAVKCILECDGGTRDVTFTPTTEEAVGDFVHMLLLNYKLESAFDHEGVDRTNQLHTPRPLDGCSGYVHAVFTNKTKLIQSLQIFVDWDGTSGDYCVEVSFFPNDVDRQAFSLDRFHDVIERWTHILRADDYFVRYENASWDLYDPDGLGVIFTRKQPPVAEQLRL